MALKTYALTTVARLSSYLEITAPTGAQETVMEAIINSVTEFIENYTGRRFKKTTYTQEEYDTERSQTINLQHLPVISGTFTLERRTSDLNEDDWEVVDPEYYHVDYDNGIIEGAGDLFFSKTHNGYRVTYVAGYDFDNTSTFLSDTKAGDVELVAWRLCEVLWNKKKGGSDVTSERIGDYSVTYRKSVFDDPDLKGILDQYVDVGDIGPITPTQS